MTQGLDKLLEIARAAIADPFFYADMDQRIGGTEETGYHYLTTNESKRFASIFNPRLIEKLLAEIAAARNLIDYSMCGFINDETDAYDTARARVDEIIKGV